VHGDEGGGRLDGGLAVCLLCLRGGSLVVRLFCLLFGGYVVGYRLYRLPGAFCEEGIHLMGGRACLCLQDGDGGIPLERGHRMSRLGDGGGALWLPLGGDGCRLYME